MAWSYIRDGHMGRQSKRITLQGICLLPLCCICPCIHCELLQEFFPVCQEHNLRTKLKTSEFLCEVTEYLGFDVGYGWWTPAVSKPKPLMDAQIIKDNPMQAEKKVQSFIGACTFYSRHIRNFTYMSPRRRNLF